MLWEVEIRPREGEIDRDGANVLAEAGVLGASSIRAVSAARSYLIEGDIDEAFRWLDVSREVRDPGTRTVLVDHFLDALHDDPRWPKFIDSIGFGE